MFERCSSCNGVINPETQKHLLVQVDKKWKHLNCYDEMTLKADPYDMDEMYNTVNEVLRSHEDARNNDTFLILKIWQKFAKFDFNYSDIFKLPPAESITRCRRKIQHDEKRYQPTNPEVVERRRINEEKVKVWSKS